MKKILFVINTMGRAGAEKSLIALLKSIDYSRCDVSLLSIINRGELFDEVPPNVNIINKNPNTEPVLGFGGLVYIAINILKRFFWRGYFFKFIPYAFKNIFLQLKNGRFRPDKLFWKLLADTTPADKQEYDLAIAFLEGAATYYTSEKIHAMVKMTFVHVDYEKAGYDKTNDKAYYENMDYVCCISAAIKDVFCKIYPEYTNKVRIFPNIMLPEEILTAAEEKISGEFNDFKGLKILTVGRLHHQKGYDLAIPAFAELVKQGYDNINWYVLGDGADKGKLQKLIRKHGLEGRFILLGSRPNPYPYIKNCDIYVQPSRFEGFPLTLAEAFILQKPCIVSDFAGARERLGENALIFELSEENISQAVKQLVDDDKLRQSYSAATLENPMEFPNKTHVLYEIMEGESWEN